MKKILLILCALLITSPVWASNTTGPANWDKGNLSNYFKTIHGHDHDYADIDTNTQNKKRSEQGVGADVLLYDNKDIDLVGEYKYDWANGDSSVYAVVKTKKSLWSLITGIFGK